MIGCCDYYNSCEILLDDITLSSKFCFLHVVLIRVQKVVCLLNYHLSVMFVNAKRQRAFRKGCIKFKRASASMQ